MLISTKRQIAAFRKTNGGSCQFQGRIHSTRQHVLAVSMSDGEIFSYFDGVPGTVRPSEKDGWETPLNQYLASTELDRQQVLREILAFVNELPENHTARVAVLGTNIKELSHADN